MADFALGERPLLVTGAGFSALAGIPLQRALLPMVLGPSYSDDPGNGKQHDAARTTVTEFLNAVFFGHGRTSVVWPEDEDRLRHLTLEDVYTVSDKAIARHDWLPEHDWQATAEVRRALDACVITYLRQCEAQYAGDEYYRLAERFTRNYGVTWATLTLNWDTVWDRSLQRVLAPGGQAVDYGLRSLRLLGDGQPEAELAPAVRLLKLHGSFNWLTCPRCHELFVSAAAPGAPFPFDSCCPMCSKTTGGPKLEPMILTPTLLKSYENASLMRVWDEAVRALDQATDILFVGYSFPVADYDFRYLLRRVVHGETRLWVVLQKGDEPKGKPLSVRHLMAEARYHGFFGLSRDSFYYEGWQAFFDRILPT